MRALQKTHTPMGLDELFYIMACSQAQDSVMYSIELNMYRVE